jgi:hypothetical protein
MPLTRLKEKRSNHQRFALLFDLRRRSRGYKEGVKDV